MADQAPLRADELVVIRELLAVLEQDLAVLPVAGVRSLKDGFVALGAESKPLERHDAPSTKRKARLTSLLVPAAAIAYCRSLLAGMVALIESEQARLVGILLRSLYETWLVGLYCLFGGLDAVERLLEARDHRLAPLDRAFGFLATPVGPGQHLSVKNLAQHVDAMVADQPEVGLFYDNAEQLYQTMYALDSYELVHGGLGALQRYIADVDGRPRAITLHPPDAGLGWQKVALAALLTIDLARPVWRLAGLNEQRLVVLEAALRDANRIRYYGSEGNSGNEIPCRDGAVASEL